MTTTEKTSAQLRAERAKRAREAGNKKTAVTIKSVKPTDPPALFSDGKEPAAKTTPARKPPVKPSKVTENKAAERKPAKRSTKAAPVKNPEPRSFDLNTAVSTMELDHVQCRDFGHSWKPYTARWLPKFNSYESQLVCARCKTIRTRFLSRTGQQLESAYDYADGYLIKGMGRLTGSDRDVIRLASILAVLETPANDE